jgi:hypothetical protein
MPKLRAPKTDGGLLLWPPPGEWRGIVEDNRRRLAAFRGRVAAEPLIATGHQAEPFHPGVWVKNFLIRRLASAVGGRAVNLIVDTDAPRTSLLHVPTESDGRPVIENVRFADFRTDTALGEQRLDRDLLRSAARRICETQRHNDICRGMGFWASVIEGAGAPARNASEVLSAGRIRAEAELGLPAIDERPVSSLPIAGLADALIADAGRFRDCYNSAVADYRRRNKVRGRGRPVPELETRGDRIELPFWGYRRGQPRRRLFCRGESLFLDDEPAARDDIVIAPRALSLTLFARMFLADVFLHGIGGAKYDEVTDDIIRRFYGVEPPRYLVATATLWLPLPDSAVRPDEERNLVAAERDLTHNPERLIPTLSDAERAMVAEKRRLASEADALRASASESRAADLHERRKAVRVRIAEINDRLRAAHPEAAEDVRRRREDLERRLRHNRIAHNREWFFGLYPPGKIRDLLAGLPDFR